MKEAKSITTKNSTQEKGTIIVADKASAGDTVDITVQPEKGCQLDSISALDSSSNPIELTGPNESGNYSFVMPDSDVTVVAAFSGDPEYQIQSECDEEKGTINVGKEYVKPGEAVKIKVTSKNNNTVDYVTVTTKDDEKVECNPISSDTYQFIMPSKSVVIRAYFCGAITVKTASGEGTAEITPTTAHTNEAVTITVKPADGYELKSITGSAPSLGIIPMTTVQDKKVYSFSMVSDDVAIDLQFIRSDHIFKDVSEQTWYYEPVKYVVEKGYMAGTGYQEFSPNMSVTRAMVAQILYAIEGKPAFSGSSAFDDIRSEDWYYNAVNWAAKNNLVAGYGNRQFGPNNPVSREQLAAILYRYTEFKKYDTSPTTELSKFNDAGAISNWATKSMKWAVASELISGVGNNTIAPLRTASRAQLATILRAYDQKVRK